MDQIILKYIDKQNYFFLNYFEKKVFNLKNNFLGFFYIKNDSLQITWNNKLIEEFIFYSKNNELINIYKNINENNTNINIIHKKWSLKLIINNNTNQVFNSSLEQIYGIVQKINGNIIKINWQYNIYEHKEVEKFILNLENNNYYLIEEDTFIGKQAIIDNCEQVSSYFQSVTTDFKTLNIIAEGNKVVINGTAEFLRDNQRVSFVSACDVYEFDDNHQIQNITSYCIQSK